MSAHLPAAGRGKDSADQRRVRLEAREERRHPGSELLGREAIGQVAELLVDEVGERGGQALAVLEVPVDGPLGDAGARGDAADGQVGEPARLQLRGKGLEDAPAGGGRLRLPGGRVVGRH